ncbi:MAG: GNAT family N-acetyltransferase [Ignavibacteriaceae bacterium]
MISYIDKVEDITSGMLNGFFVSDWKTFPSEETHLQILKNSEYKILAIKNDKVVGFINAITDGVLSAYIPLLEVLPQHKNKGIGTELVKRMLEKLKDFYMIDIVCDESVQKFYEKCGMKKYSAMIIRNYSKQDGIKK